MNWISVEEKLPEECSSVLTTQVRANGEKIVRISHYFHGMTTEGDWYVEDQSFKKQPTVTHWMPLPDPPVESSASPQVTPQNELSPRKKVYAFMQLPYHRQVERAQNLGLYEDSDANLIDSEKMLLWVKRAKAKGVENELLVGAED